MPDIQSHQRQEDDQIDLSKIFLRMLESWKLFLVFVPMGLMLAYAYVWYVHPVYVMEATVLVEDESNDISQSILDEVGVLSKKRNIENEIAILSSRSMMERALSTQVLNINYAVVLGLKKRNLYVKLPFKLDYSLSDVSIPRFDMSMTVSEDGDHAEITFNYKKSHASEEIEFVEEISFGDDFNNQLGHFRFIKTPFFDEMVVSDTALSRDYELIFHSPDLLTTTYLEKLRVEEAREQASILKLTLEDRIPERGVDVLTAILSVYIQDNIEKKNQLASNALKFIDKELGVITSDLETLEEDIKLYKANSGITDVSSEATFFLQQVGSLDRTMSELDVKLSIISYLEEYIRNDKDLNNASPSSLGLSDPLLTSLIVTLSELSSERESMLKFTKPDNPLVTSIDIKIKDTKSSLTNNIQSIRSGLLASKEEIGTQMEKVESKVSSLPQAEYELLALQRQYSIKESLYLLLLEKKSENSILLASTISDNMVLDKARSSDKPISPMKKIIYLLGLMAGLGIPLIYVGLISIFDDRIKNLDDLKNHIHIPFLGIIPHNEDSDYLVIKDNTNSPISEAFRSIRTNLNFVIGNRSKDVTDQQKVIQVTSAIGSEGKSFFSINLAASLALGGSRTIVVGLDLRKPRLAEYFNVSNNVGASSVLAEISDLDSAIQNTGHANFDLMVGGPVPPNPSELLLSPNLPKLLHELSDIYDYVVIDTPPIGLVTDSLILAEHASTTIYVVRQGVTKISTLSYINELYQTKKINSLTAVLNDAKQSRFSYGYGYGYGYGYNEKSNSRWSWKSLLGRS
jgi:tyrosine-protein kinase Etk/Wzc